MWINRGEMAVNLSEHWKNRLSRRQLPNNLILIGENKRQLAEYFAKAAVCEGANPPCGVCIHCRKVAAGIHPDVKYLGTDGESIKVDAVRQLRADAYLRPNEAERKVYVIEQAHSMNPSGQNALLKLLEEGPDYAVFLFLPDNPEQLLPTLRSRCETLRTDAAQTTQQFDSEAAEFVTLICTADKPLEMAAFCVGLEKKKREDLTALLDRTMEALTPRLVEQPKRLLPKMDALREVRAACDYTVGVAHLAGWLMARLT